MPTRRVFIVLREDVVHYPPVLTIFNVLVNMGFKVLHIGVYSDVTGRKYYEDKGVEFLPTISCNGKASFPVKLYEKNKFRRQVRKHLKASKGDKEDYLWIMQESTVCLLHDIIPHYRTILHFFEFTTGVNWKYRLMNPGFDLRKSILAARNTVCCEYNRAQIMKGMLQLPTLPIVLPNKILVDDGHLNDVPEDIRLIMNEVKKRVDGKKVILYQGIFLEGERKLEEFCQAVSELPDDYAFIAMGKGDMLFDRLKEKYESGRILFLPFIRPPFHLLITKLATIGVLSYFPRPGSFARTINPLYCAPNKIFEYARFGIPMISNDIPALRYAYLEYGCGRCIPYPMTAANIKETMEFVLDDYRHFSEGAVNYFNSVDVESIIRQILDDEEFR